MALLVILKLVATTSCYASGNAGGIFGPSLFIGAMMGGAIGGGAHMLLPDYTGSLGAYALVGMGACFAGIIRVPLTSVIMIFEITRDYSIIVPLMIANLIAYFISTRLQEEPIYEALLHQDGIHLPLGERAREALLMVGNAYQRGARLISAEERVQRVLEGLEPERGAWPVVDQNGLRGMVTLAQLEEAVKTGRGKDSIGTLVPDPGPRTELDIATFPHVHLDHSLDTAMRRIAESGFNALPVVSRSNIRDIKGTISLQDVLAAYGVGKAEAAPPAETPRAMKAPGVVLAGVVVVLIAVATLGGFLNYFYRSERVARAQRYFKEANELMSKERYPEAIERYRTALSITHTYEDRMALASALVKAGRLNEAEVYLNELVRSNPNSGPVNLELARAYAGQGRIQDAVSHFHRAIYGSWPHNPQQNRTQTRLELIDVLGKVRLRKQAQAELLSLLDDLPPDTATQKRIGRLLMDYGLDKQALDLYREMARRDSQDAAIYDGMGEAEFALSDYRGARDAYRAAVRLDPADASAANRLDIAEKILALDPAQRGIGAAERYRRSNALLQGTVGLLDECAAAHPDAAFPAPLSDALANARKLLAVRRRPRSYAEAADTNLETAEQLWSARTAVCGNAPKPPEPLARIMTRLSH